MTENDRLRTLRKELGLTLEKFGEKIGVKKASISAIELGRRDLTDHMFKSICREYNVNPDWLRTGEGDMFVTLTRYENIAAFMGELMQEEEDSFKVRLIGILAELPEEKWAVLAELADRLSKE